jgi:ketosteroid isomerase-like protein
MKKMNAIKQTPFGLLFAGVIAVLASGCQAPPAPEPVAPAPDYEAEFGRVVEAFRQVWNNQDYDGMDAVMTPDYQRIAPDANADGREAMKEFVRNVHAAYADFHITFDEIWYAESSAATVWTVTGTSDGKSFRLNGATILVFAGGMISEEHVYYDRQTLSEQLEAAAVPHVSE